jgi:DNA-binding LacI/PurR family transcriptional regulator
MTPRSATAPTLADVAKHIGVSRTTVSNAYNRPDQLSPALRERVLAAAGELGYGGPDPVARSLRRGRAGSLGLVFDHPLRYIFDDPAAVLFLSGVAAGCEEHGTGLALVPQLPAGAAEVVRSALVDGYVMFCTPEDDERLEAVIARGLPYVLVDYSPYVPGPHVNIDDRGGARAVAQHLVDLGHRRIGIVLPYEKWGTEIPYGEVPEATAERAEQLSKPDRVTDYRRWRCFIRYERLVGWREALEGAGIDWSAVPVASAPGSDAETGHRAAARLLDRADRPSAIICLSDVLALGVMRAAAERGIRIPQDLSVVGYDDIGDAATAGLTTVYQSHAGKGEAAVRLLGAGEDAEDVVLPTDLVVRASSGPVPSC